MLKGCSIICFGKDWSEAPTSNNHVMSRLAEENTILWVNSIAMRIPSLASKKDLKKILQKLKEKMQGLRHVNKGLNIATPLVIPLWKVKAISNLNKWLIRLQLKAYMKKLKMKNIQLWIFYPTAGEVVGQFDEDLVVYYCTDDWAGFSYLDPVLMKKLENKLLKKTDIVMATSRVLFEKFKEKHNNVYFAPHGVDFDFFSSIDRAKVNIPQDISDVPGPIIGMYGLIRDWIDFNLLREAALKHPDWSFVVIGKVITDIAKVSDLKNVYFLGEKSYKDMSVYGIFFDAAIIPYDLRDPLMHSVNPIKLREYLAMGLPVVSVGLNEVRPYNNVVYIAKNYSDFIRGIEKSLAENNIEKSEARKRAVQDETWDNKVEALSEIIEETLRAKKNSGCGLSGQAG